MRKIFSDKIFKATSLLFVCTMFGNISGLIYQAFMSRTLSVEDFGALNSLLSVFAILSLPVQTLHTTVAGITSHLKAQQAFNSISRLFFKMLLKVSIVGLCGIVIFTLFSGYLREFLNIYSVYPLLIVGILALFSFLLSVNNGILQGLQSFSYFGIMSGLNGFLKLVFGVLFVYLGLGVAGAIGGVAMGIFVIFLSSTIILHVSLSRLSSQDPIAEPQTYPLEGFSYSIPVLIALLCFTSLTNMDLVLAKHYFPAEEAGHYAVAAVLGKVVLFLPAAIVLAMFPMVSESHALKEDSYHILKKSVAFAGLLSFIGILVYVLFPELLVTILMGAKHAQIAHLVRLYGIAMLPFVFINIFMYFNLATHRLKFLYLFIAGSLVEILLICLYHSSLQQVIYILISVGCTLLAVNIFLIWTDLRKNDFNETPFRPPEAKDEEINV